MLTYKRLIGVVATFVILSLTVAGNFLVATRDGSMTIGMESFEPKEIVGNRLWTETPIQILHTHMADSVQFVGVGFEGQGGLPFANRLVFNYGADQVDQSERPLDLRGLPKTDLEALERFVKELSYRSVHPCPHDPTSDCTIAIGWNRQRTKAKDMLIISTRIGDSLYLLVDESIINISKGEG
jgi:hypothetical protein